MNAIRVYMADIENKFVDDVRRAVASARGLRFVGASSNGADALKQVAMLRPDVLIADVQLPELDGLCLLMEARRLPRPPIVILCTRFCSPYSVDAAAKYGASCYLCKPVSASRLTELIRECSSIENAAEGAKDASEVEALRLRELLIELGVSPSLKGSRYMVEAIRLARENPVLLKNLSQGLYAQIAVKAETSPSGVERALRHAIGVACERGALAARFPDKPSNKAFLHYLLQRVKSESADEEHPEFNNH